MGQTVFEIFNKNPQGHFAFPPPLLPLPSPNRVKGANSAIVLHHETLNFSWKTDNVNVSAFADLRSRVMPILCQVIDRQENSNNSSTKVDIARKFYRIIMRETFKSLLNDLDSICFREKRPSTNP